MSPGPQRKFCTASDKHTGPGNDATCNPDPEFTELVDKCGDTLCSPKGEMYFLPVGGQTVAGSRWEIKSPRNVNESGQGAI